MANSARRSLNYKPRVSEAEAYERLPITLKRCLQEAIVEWCSRSVLAHFEKHGLSKTIAEVHRWDDYQMRKKIQTKKFKKAELRSTNVECNDKPLRTYGIKPTTRIGQAS